MFENLGFQEIALVAIVFIVFFGPKKIPELMNGIGRGMREFKKAMNEVQGEISKLAIVPPNGYARTTHEVQMQTPQIPTVETPHDDTQLQTAKALTRET